MKNVPAIKVICKCGNEWLMILAPWEVSWKEWNGEHSKCKKCGKLPKSWIWYGMT